MVVINHQYGGNKSPNMVVINHQYGGNKPLLHNGGYYPPVLVVYTIHPLSTDFGGLFPPVFLQCDTPEELTQIWEAHFRKLLSPEIPICEVPCYDPVVPPDILFRTDPFDEEELSEAIYTVLQVQQSLWSRWNAS